MSLSMGEREGRRAVITQDICFQEESDDTLPFVIRWAYMSKL